jgi:hypothetical protein
MFGKNKKNNLLPKDLLGDLTRADDVREKVTEQVHKARSPGYSPRGVQFGPAFDYTSMSASETASASASGSFAPSGTW